MAFQGCLYHCLWLVLFLSCQILPTSQENPPQTSGIHDATHGEQLPLQPHSSHSRTSGRKSRITSGSTFTKPGPDHENSTKFSAVNEANTNSPYLHANSFKIPVIGQVHRAKMEGETNPQEVLVNDQRKRSRSNRHKRRRHRRKRDPRKRRNRRNRKLSPLSEQMRATGELKSSQRRKSDSQRKRQRGEHSSSSSQFQDLSQNDDTSSNTEMGASFISSSARDKPMTAVIEKAPPKPDPSQHQESQERRGTTVGTSTSGVAEDTTTQTAEVESGRFNGDLWVDDENTNDDNSLQSHRVAIVKELLEKVKELHAQQFKDRNKMDILERKVKTQNTENEILRTEVSEMAQRVKDYQQSSESQGSQVHDLGKKLGSLRKYHQRFRRDMVMFKKKITQEIPVIKSEISKALELSTNINESNNDIRFLKESYVTFREESTSKDEKLLESYNRMTELETRLAQFVDSFGEGKQTTKDPLQAQIDLRDNKTRIEPIPLNPEENVAKTSTEPNHVTSPVQETTPPVKPQTNAFELGGGMAGLLEGIVKERILEIKRTLPDNGIVDDEISRESLDDSFNIPQMLENIIEHNEITAKKQALLNDDTEKQEEDDLSKNALFDVILKVHRAEELAKQSNSPSSTGSHSVPPSSTIPLLAPSEVLPSFTSSTELGKLSTPPLSPRMDTVTSISPTSSSERIMKTSVIEKDVQTSSVTSHDDSRSSASEGTRSSTIKTTSNTTSPTESSNVNPCQQKMNAPGGSSTITPSVNCSALNNLTEYITQLETRVKVLEDSISNMTSAKESTVNETASNQFQFNNTEEFWTAVKRAAMDALLSNESVERLNASLMHTNDREDIRQALERLDTELTNSTQLWKEEMAERDAQLEQVQSLAGRTSVMLSQLASQVASIDMGEFIKRLQEALASFTSNVLTLDQWAVGRDSLRNATLDNEARITRVSQTLQETSHSVAKLHDKVTNVHVSGNRGFRSLQGHVIRLNNTVQDMQETLHTLISEKESSVNDEPHRNASVFDAKANETDESVVDPEDAVTQAKLETLNVQLLYNANRLSSLEARLLNQTLTKCKKTTAEKQQEATVRKLDEVQETMKSEISRLQEKVKRVDMSMFRAHGTLGNHDKKLQILDARTLELAGIQPELSYLRQEMKNILYNVPKDCQGYYERGYRESGVYVIYPQNVEQSIRVYCLMEEPHSPPSGEPNVYLEKSDKKKASDEDEDNDDDDDADEMRNDHHPQADEPGDSSGGWTVIQRRHSGMLNFTREWSDYVSGFGQPADEHWLGNDVIHHLSEQGQYEVRFVMKDEFGETWEARYHEFIVDSAANNYRLHVAGYHGNATDGLTKSDKMGFSTLDKDNDAGSKHCALFNGGGWWYSHCQVSNLNGPYNFGMVWFNVAWNDWVQLKESRIMMRPRKW